MIDNKALNIKKGSKFLNKLEKGPKINSNKIPKVAILGTIAK
jgi:hypothetical protein